MHSDPLALHLHLTGMVNYFLFPGTGGREGERGVRLFLGPIFRGFCSL